MLTTLCFILCASLGSDSTVIDKVLVDGARVVVLLGNLENPLDIADIQDRQLRIAAPLEPLTDIILVITNPYAAAEDAEILTFEGVVGPKGDDILVVSGKGAMPISLGEWFQSAAGITLILNDTLDGEGDEDRGEDSDDDADNDADEDD